MENPITVKIYPSDLAEMLIGIETMCSGLSAGAFELNLQGILKRNEELSEYQNAYDYLCKHYDELQGAIRTIGAILHAISVALIDEQLKFAPGE